jgi:hypothetical protein
VLTVLEKERGVRRSKEGREIAGKKGREFDLWS